MIIGIGIDSIEIERVMAAVDSNPRLRQRLFTRAELAQLPPGQKAGLRLAALFAAKEAVFKALGTGLAGHSWQEAEIYHDGLGAPKVRLRGKAAETAAHNGVTRLHMSISHDRSRALAFCIAEGEEKCSG